MRVDFEQEINIIKNIFAIKHIIRNSSYDNDMFR